jgi:hypothetical protein
MKSFGSFQNLHSIKPDCGLVSLKHKRSGLFASYKEGAESVGYDKPKLNMNLIKDKKAHDFIPCMLM